MAKGILSLILNTLGFTTWSWAILENLSDIKGWILFGVGLVFSYYKLKEAKATIIGKQLDNKLKKSELDSKRASKDIKDKLKG